MDKQPIDLMQYTAQLAEVGGFLSRACSFTGHRPQKFPWRYNESDPACVALKETLAGQISRLYETGYTEFLTGMALGVDLWAAQIVLDLRRKKRGLGIFGLGRKNDAPKLHCILPCEGQEDKWPRSSQERYRDILKQADSIVYVSREYDDQCMLRRNHVLVDFSSVVLAVYNGGYRSGTAETVRYARRLGREVIVIDPLTRSVTHEKTAP